MENVSVVQDNGNVRSSRTSNCHDDYIAGQPVSWVLVDNTEAVTYGELAVQVQSMVPPVGWAGDVGQLDPEVVSIEVPQQRVAVAVLLIELQAEKVVVLQGHSITKG